MITTRAEPLFRKLQEPTMVARRTIRTYGLEDGDYCPVCLHAMTIGGPAHFSDCRYFSLDDDRDEEPPTRFWLQRGEMNSGGVQTEAA